MSALFESCMNRLQDDENRNKVTSVIAGSFFAVGWWIIIDISTHYFYPEFNNAYHVCGVLGTISLLIINSVPTSRIEMYSYGVSDYTMHIWLFFGFVLGFGALIASLWILFGAFVVTGANILPGLGVFFQNLFIFLGSIIFKFGRKYDDY
ncbi:Glycogen synthase kinase-3 beta [Sarcoptes scabiei]|nr:Glycogen synthase kinase-3 beta [Sarcoptes scabiei]